MNKFLIISLLIAVLFITFKLLNNKSEIERLSAEEFRIKHAETPGVVIDVRTQEEFDAGHLTLTEFHRDLLNGDFEASLDELDKEDTYYLYCRSGNRSGKAAKIMKDNGFEHVFNIGGYDSLKVAGFATER